MQRSAAHPVVPKGKKTGGRPRHANGGGANGGGAEGKNASPKQQSLLEVYRVACRDLGVHPNSAVASCLPSKNSHTLPSETLDLQRNYLGDRGTQALIPVLLQATNVERLVLSENGLRNNAAKALCAALLAHPTLVDVDLSNNYISVGAGEMLVRLAKENPKISRINIEHTQLDVQHRVAIQAALRDKPVAPPIDTNPSTE